MGHAKLAELVAPTVEAMNFELWGVQYQQQSGAALLRVYIESPDGVSVEDCASISRQLSHLLDVEDPIQGEYRLEVSSPGMERPFFSLEQYSRFIGSTVSVRLRYPFEGRRKFKGILTATDNGELVINDGEHEYSLPYESLEKGNLVPSFGEG